MGNTFKKSKKFEDEFDEDDVWDETTHLKKEEIRRQRKRKQDLHNSFDDTDE